ncbi:antibiotic biosynthesis monooxygenase family protein [Rhodococcus daqingensis]|uniref:Antibiotic biosynthesis monooxygenase family protein n=1 Tax=Rhodococcus daqingensis TaxID=2479363 RepID=A0ABW2RS12_9NOCA
MSTDTSFYSIIDYTVDGPRTQTELVDAFAELQDRWVSFYPGYVSARFHVSTDGSRVYNIVHWASEADYRNFIETSDTEGRVSDIAAALGGITGTAEPRMSGIPTYTVVREVGPRAPESGDAV